MKTYTAEIIDSADYYDGTWMLDNKDIPGSPHLRKLGSSDSEIKSKIRDLATKIEVTGVEIKRGTATVLFVLLSDVPPHLKNIN